MEMMLHFMSHMSTTQITAQLPPTSNKRPAEIVDLTVDHSDIEALVSQDHASNSRDNRKRPDIRGTPMKSDDDFESQSTPQRPWPSSPDNSYEYSSPSSEMTSTPIHRRSRQAHRPTPPPWAGFHPPDIDSPLQLQEHGDDPSTNTHQDDISMSEPTFTPFVNADGGFAEESVTLTQIEDIYDQHKLSDDKGATARPSPIQQTAGTHTEMSTPRQGPNQGDKSQPHQAKPEEAATSTNHHE